MKKKKQKELSMSKRTAVKEFQKLLENFGNLRCRKYFSKSCPRSSHGHLKKCCRIQRVSRVVMVRCGDFGCVTEALQCILGAFQSVSSNFMRFSNVSRWFQGLLVLFRGYNGVSMKILSKGTQVSVRAVYWQFRESQEVFRSETVWNSLKCPCLVFAK